MEFIDKAEWIRGVAHMHPSCYLMSQEDDQGHSVSSSTDSETCTDLFPFLAQEPDSPASILLPTRLLLSGMYSPTVIHQNCICKVLLKSYLSRMPLQMVWDLVLLLYLLLKLPVI